MHLCYLDESGTPELTGSTTHFVLLGIAVPASSWRARDESIAQIKAQYDLHAAEIHTGWMTRRYAEQDRVAEFHLLDRPERRKRAAAQREAMLLHTAATKPASRLAELKKTMRKTEPYIHLTLEERIAVLRQIAGSMANWTDSAIFCDAIDKRQFGDRVGQTPPIEEAFLQVVTRFHSYLESRGPTELGIIIADNNQAASSQLTGVMRDFYRRGAGRQYRWGRNIDQIVETPLFVDSFLTGMIQMADVCAYATRRFFENGEIDLFDRIYMRFHRNGRRLVGLRHFTGPQACGCRVCVEHGRPV